MQNWTEIELFIFMKMDLALNNLEWLICHKTKLKPTKVNGFKLWQRECDIIYSSWICTSCRTIVWPVIVLALYPNWVETHVRNGSTKKELRRKHKKLNRWWFEEEKCDLSKWKLLNQFTCMFVFSSPILWVPPPSLQLYLFFSAHHSIWSSRRPHFFWLSSAFLLHTHFRRQIPSFPLSLVDFCEYGEANIPISGPIYGQTFTQYYACAYP